MFKTNEFYKIAYNIAVVNNVTEIKIYDEIASKKSFDFWTGEEGNEFTPNDIISALEKATGDVLISINSGGGDIFAAEAISNTISDYLGKGKIINCKIVGVCASSAVRIAFACLNVEMPKSAYLMIHDPMFFNYGYLNEKQMDKMTCILKSLKQGIINAYHDKTGIDKDEISTMMSEETWLTGLEAYEKGLVNKLNDNIVSFESLENAQNKLKTNGTILNFSNYTKLPEIIQNKMKERNTEMTYKNITELKEAYPVLAKDIANEASTNAVNLERARIKALDGLAGKITDEAINKAKFETFEDESTVIVNAFKSGDVINTAVLDGLNDDASGANGVAGGTPQPENSANSELNKTANIVKNMFAKK